MSLIEEQKFDVRHLGSQDVFDLNNLIDFLNIFNIVGKVAGARNRCFFKNVVVVVIVVIGFSGGCNRGDV